MRNAISCYRFYQQRGVSDEKINFKSRQRNQSQGHLRQNARLQRCTKRVLRLHSQTLYINVTYDEGIQRNISPELNRFYNLLCKLGYVMSDEEIQLRDGTHPIFTSGEVK